MFRLLRVKTNHRGNAVAGEFVIVTGGVLMALALQQWAENLASASRTARARDAIRQELSDHYLNAVEWRAFSPCVTAQLELIEKRIASSRSLMQPIERRVGLSKIPMAVMAPRRIYDNSAWMGAINDGTAFQLRDLERKQLPNEYWLAGQMGKLGDELVDGDVHLLSATRPVDLDPEVKLTLLHAVDKMQAANDLMNNTAAQIIFWVDRS